MERQGDRDSASVVRRLPVMELLDTASAARLLGLESGLFRALRFFRCLPAALRIRSQRFYRRSELEKLREEWCKAVRVRPEDRIVALGHEADTDIDRQLDPLMRVLALRAIRHRIMVSIFWTMIITGGAICLTLY
ncbi:hypothetical protein [Asaia sp. As-1742]|uniref:hypothetical protein n=1 Tax=Asaia sp. As-1742 TaxID=2608325 RepID=UPI0014218CC9|nr:hypothetical protein [Asaia sp. As-1742]NIE80292.1 hypothetical protein [Asaia sp. As-1742]